jgi:transposase
MMDNAPYHRGVGVREQMKALKLPVLFLGPYHFRMAPVEMVFNFIKSHDLNPLGTKGTAR